ncbi:MAG: YggT family protein [Helicobacteraceae bacterium]|nr:YggT family protein [Helicobacteraceae bacterium]
MDTVIGIVVGIGGILNSLINVYIWVLIIAALISWVQPDPSNPVVQILRRLTEPAYSLVRNIPTVFNGLDLAPIIIIVGLQVISVVLVNVLNSLAMGQ